MSNSRLRCEIRQALQVTASKDAKKLARPISNEVKPLLTCGERA